MKKTILATLFLTMASVNAHAVGDLNTATDRSNSISREQSESMRRSQEERDSKTSRSGETFSRTSEGGNSTNRSNRQSKDESTALDSTVSLPSLFLPFAPAYKLPADFGLGGEEENGLINASAQQYFAAAGKASSQISKAGGDEEALLEYCTEYIQFAERAAEAVKLLNEDLKALGEKKKTIRGMGRRDLELLAGGAFKRATVKHSKLAELKHPCKFAGGGHETILCGRVRITLTAPPSLQVAGVPYLSDSHLAGVSASFKISSSWSYAESLEKLATSGSRWAFVADEAKTAEHLESLGRSREAQEARRKTISKTRKSGAGMSSGSVTPSVH